MNIEILIQDAGIEQSTAFIEIIKLLERKKINIKLVVAFQLKGYQYDQYYQGNDYVKIEVLQERSIKNGLLEKVKNVIRKFPMLEKVMTDAIVFLKAIKFKMRHYDKNKESIYDMLLSSPMKSYLPEKDTDFIWVVDESGLVWARWINEQINRPVKIIYHCLELYWEHYSLVKEKNWRYYDKYLLFEVARLELLKSYLIIIQDEDRWKVLCRYTGLNEHHRKVIMPVSIQDYTVYSDVVLNERCDDVNIGEKRVVLYPTLISAKRGCLEIVKNFKLLSAKYTLLIHGFQADKGYLNRMQKYVRDSANISISNCSLGYQELLALHRNIWCGFLFYGEADNNDRYIVNSSNKLVMFLQAGKPIIVIGNHSLAQLCKEYRCGAVLNDWSKSELLGAIADIEKHYDEYCENAYLCYKERFDTVLYAEALYQEIGEGLNNI